MRSKIDFVSTEEPWPMCIRLKLKEEISTTQTYSLQLYFFASYKINRKIRSSINGLIKHDQTLHVIADF